MNLSDTLSGKRVGTRGRAGLLFLVVDDDALSRELLTLLLEVEGYEVEVAVSGEAAVSRVTSCAQGVLPVPDVILTDIQMPGLAGNDLASTLRTAFSRRTLLLAMSGSQTAASALTGFDGFLLKPFKASELRALIHEAAPISQAGAVVTEPVKFAQTVMPTEAPDANALDEDIYDKMCELMPTAQLGQMYALCVEDARKRIERMRTSAESSDDAQYRSEAHAVKGGCGMIGAKELYMLAAEAEQTGLPQREAAPGTTSVTATLTQLSLACDRLERILGERM